MWNRPFLVPSAALLVFRFATALPQPTSDSLRGADPDRNQRTSSLIATRPDDPRHRLQICNALTPPLNRSTLTKKHLSAHGGTWGTLLVRHVQHHEILTHHLEFKRCHEVSARLRDGDQLEFLTGGTDVGTFSFTQLPIAPTTLLLVVHRKRGSTVADFKSHAFTEIEGASQVAIIDAAGEVGEDGGVQPRGRKVLIQAAATPEPTDVQKDATVHSPMLTSPALVEELPLNSVVQVKPGKYSIGIGSVQTAFVAEPRASYVVMRVRDASSPASKDDEVIIFPQEGEGMQGTATRSAVMSGMAFFGTLATIVLALPR